MGVSDSCSASKSMLVWGDDDDDVAISVSCYTCAIPVVLKKFHDDCVRRWWWWWCRPCYVVSLSSSNAARLQGPRSCFGGEDYAATNFGGKVFGMWKCLFSPPPQFMHCAKMLKVEDLLLSCVCVCVCFDLQADVFQASPSDDYPSFWGNLYGGQLMGQVCLYDHP